MQGSRATWKVYFDMLVSLQMGSPPVKPETNPNAFLFVQVNKFSFLNVHEALDGISLLNYFSGQQADAIAEIQKEIANTKALLFFNRRKPAKQNPK
ncbi:MAG: hypothetical protein U1D70_16700 [Methylobacter sp.]|nr:hypothetical protein [Methylobacter sp.]MDP2428543.1 hypothetical protein [Methylobacter sp.]MDP3054101.1 hypothetical protein [Methylobacter sp.]MDP3363125.1 hypothetical protein [Methylobacter sp.]MDZ4220645.1 hypothetical protein [Methylobacter sp.]